MAWWLPTYVFPILGAVIAGGLIGFEREYRGRPAGFRTHILVALTAALLMLSAVHQMRWMMDTPMDVVRIDPVRMAHGILTGVGFLCGGVIFREGFSVHGLTTAASLWITSALGTLYGVGFYGLAVGGTVAAVAVLAGLRWLDFHMPRVAHVDIAISYPRASAPAEHDLRRILGEHNLTPWVIRQQLVEDTVTFSSTVRGRAPAAAQALGARLMADPTVLAFDISPRDE